jgi:hypothetical protein
MHPHPSRQRDAHVGYQQAPARHGPQASDRHAHVARRQ